MVHVPERTAVSGPALIRLLARLTDARLTVSAQPLADRLGQWLGWTDAIALSTALGGQESSVDIRGAFPADAQDALCTRVRATLTDAIARDPMLAPNLQRSVGRGRPLVVTSADDTPPDYAAFRQCYLSRQEAMDSAIGDLRTRLRATLAADRPAMARLASVDAVMERVLGARERASLAAVPGLLSMHFDRLKAAHAAAQVTAQDTPDAAVAEEPAQQPGSAASARQRNRAPASPTASANAWLDLFRKDMQSVLLAELEIRFQPVDGLLAALRAC